MPALSWPLLFTSSAVLWHAVQDVLHSLSSWAARKYARNVATAIAGTAVAPDDLFDASANLTGELQAQLACCRSSLCMRNALI
jgi:hypothetical protein